MLAVPSFIWGVCSSAVTLLSLLPYIHKTLRGENRPHVLTWIIWSVLTGIAFSVQWTSGAGPGAWATGLTFLLCLAIILATLRHGERSITRLDWICFIAAWLALPLWVVTDSPALAAVWVTAIDGLGYIPTIRKAWHKPREEMAWTHAVANLKHVFSLLGMQTISVATVFYPLSLMLFNGILVAVILLRRRHIGRRILDSAAGVGSIGH